MGVKPETQKTKTKIEIDRQCISCLFPILRAYGTVLRLVAPGTDRQGIHIGVNMFSSVTT